MAGMETIGLALHWPCVTDFSGLSTCELSCLWKGDGHPTALPFTTRREPLGFGGSFKWHLLVVMVSHMMRVPELAVLDRSVIIDGDRTMPVVKEEDDSDRNDMLHLCSELIRSSATKIKGCCCFGFVSCHMPFLVWNISLQITKYFC